LGTAAPKLAPKDRLSACKELPEGASADECEPEDRFSMDPGRDDAPE
jgi:hypothetical protein